MISAPDFKKKQIVFVFFSDGEKLAFCNDNMVIKDCDGKIKFQCTCYRIFIVYAVGHFSLTSVLLQKAKKFGFYVALFTSGFRFIDMVGAIRDGNTLLREKQFAYEGIEIAKHIVANKICTQYRALMSIRYKNEYTIEALEKLKEYYNSSMDAVSLNGLMAYEGLSSKLYFKNFFDNVVWNGRQPRIKRDIINSTMDIGYTILFSFVEALLTAYGFDTYIGVLHRQFYMRKSLVCDMVEPFRYLIDGAIKKAFNLKQIKEADFTLTNGQYRLKWDKTPEYVSFLMAPIIENKDSIFLFIQSYYRSFMKGASYDQFPFYSREEVLIGPCKL